MPDWPVASADVESASEAVDSGFSYSPPTIVEMYQATSTVLPLMCGKRQYVFFLFLLIYYLPLFVGATANGIFSDNNLCLLGIPFCVLQFILTCFSVTLL